MVRICSYISSIYNRFKKARKIKIMKIVDETKEIDNKRCKKEIEQSVGMIEDLLIMANDLTDDYTKYRMTKAVEKIKMFNNKIK
jgi:hypothetical protein